MLIATRPAHDWLRAAVCALPILAASPAAAEPALEAGAPSSVPGFTCPAPPRPAATKFEGARLLILVDASYSARAASGFDVDGDGITGLIPRIDAEAWIADPSLLAAQEPTLSTDPGDNSLAAGLMLARRWIDSRPEGPLWIGLARCSGEVHPDTNEAVADGRPAASVVVHPTADRDVLLGGLEAIAEEGAWGASNFSAGIHAALDALSDGGAADQVRHILFLSDGLPTLPVGRGDSADPGDTEAALSASCRAAARGVRIHTYLVGAVSPERGSTIERMSMLTGGTYTIVRGSGPLPSLPLPPLH